jgi:hypothetical protein
MGIPLFHPDCRIFHRMRQRKGGMPRYAMRLLPKTRALRCDLPLDGAAAQ